MPVLPRLLLPSGVPGLDEILGGGIPETSFTVIGGPAGTGKTTLALQFAFANAAPDEPVVYFCGTSEPADRLEQHAQQLKFFNPRRLDRDLHLVNLGPHFSERDTGRVLDALAQEVAEWQPGVAVVDLPRSQTPPCLWSELVAFLSSPLSTNVLVADARLVTEPTLEATLSAADNVLWLDNTESTRTLEALKVRGLTPMPGRHYAQFGRDGVRVFPRWPTPWRSRAGSSLTERMSTGVEGLDRLLGGGALAGGSVLVEGASGSGKSVLATQFMAESAHQGLPALALLLEERPDRFMARAEAMDLQLDRLIQNGLVQLLSLRGRDVSPDELIHLVQRAVLDIGARSVVLDSVAGLELLLRDDGPVVRDVVWRLLDTLSGAGVTVWLNQANGSGPRLRSLADDVLELSRLDGVRRLEVVKSSCAVRVPGPVVFEIGRRGMQIIVRDDVRAPTNGHLVNYRIAG